MTLGRQFKLHVEEHEDLAPNPEDGFTGDVREYYSLARPRDEGSKADVWGNTYGAGYSDVHGRVEVSHYTSNPLQIQNWNQDLYGSKLRQPPALGEEEWSGKGYEPSDGQQILFRESYESESPGKSVVEGLYFSKEARAMAMPTLAAVAQRTAERYGRPLTASTDRSAHSERLVQHLDAAGAAGVTERRYANTIDFAPASARPTHVLGEELPSEALQRGKSAARAIVRGGRRRTPPTQETLF